MSSAFDTDNVTVSLSRLALAKAIKTPDETDSGAEPWTKSVIFHQSHVSDSMRQSMLFPGGQRQQRGHHARPHSQMMRSDQHPHHPRPSSRHLDHQQQQPYPQQRRRSRSSAHMLDQYNQHPNPQQQHHPYPQQQHQQPPQHQQPMRRPPSGYEMYASPSPQPSNHSGSQGHSSSQGSHHRPSSQERSTPSSGRRKVIASDNEDSDDDDKVSSDSSDEESQHTPVPRKAASIQMLNKTRATPITITQQPSDDEEDEEEDEEDSVKQRKEKNSRNVHDEDDESDEDNDDRIISQNFSEMAAVRRPSGELLDDDALKARRMSTLRQLERGPSMHKRSRSHGDLNAMAQEVEAASVSQNPYAETTGKSGAIERWRETIAEGTPTSSRPSSVQSQLDEVPTQQRASVVPPGYRRSRRSTIGEMDMMAYHMQQQQQMQWQMQQAAQMQQMAQIQQYQQYQSLQQQQAVMMMHQQQQQLAKAPPPNLNPNRKSVSAMDLLEQLEKEKEESRRKPYNPKTRVSASANTTIDSGLLGRLPAKTSHNLSFQQVEQQGGLDRNKFLMRASRSDMNLSSMGNSSHHQRQRSRSPGPERALRSSSALDVSNLANAGKSRSRVSNTDARRRSEMMRSESAPNVTPSMSTPINRQSYMPTPGNAMYGQYLVPMGQGMPMQMMGGPGMMTTSMSSGNRSGMNSSRRSTANWSNNSSGYR